MNTNTYTQTTDHATCDIYSNRSYLCTACRRCDLILRRLRVDAQIISRAGLSMRFTVKTATENWATEKWATGKKGNGNLGNHLGKVGKGKWGNRHPVKTATENWATNLLLTGSVWKKSLAYGSTAVVVTPCVSCLPNSLLTFQANKLVSHSSLMNDIVSLMKNTFNEIKLVSHYQLATCIRSTLPCCMHIRCRDLDSMRRQTPVAHDQTLTTHTLTCDAVCSGSKS